MRFPLLTPLAAAAACIMAPAAGAAPQGAGQAALPPVFPWATVANSADTMPGSTLRFNSFNQPSVNARGLVVMRARSKGEQGVGQPMRGIYSRDMGAGPGAITRVFDVDTTVPQPNNTLYDGALGTFTEFPAFPRIGMDNATIATRGQSKPVWTYVADDGTETRVGTSGVYTQHRGQGITGASQVGAAPGQGHYGVPGATPGTRFDQFPGAPAVGGSKIVFKGNFTDGVPKTGIFYRRASPTLPDTQTRVIASSDTLIPGQPVGGVRFGSTAPPSASSTHAVFLGLDNEESPTLGGIYRAALAPQAPLQTLVAIGAPVPGEAPGVAFSRLGEGLSFDGRYVGFWGAWGAESRTLLLICPEDGQKDLIAYCKEHYPDGHLVQVPVHQGMFVHDTRTRQTHAAAKTGADYLDFLYWVFSGRPPGVGEPDGDDPEPPRWRSAAFVASYHKGEDGQRAQVAFKGRGTTLPPVDGIYLTVVPSVRPQRVTLVDTTTAATVLDPAAPAGAVVTTVGIERDGLRNGWLAISASMLDAVSGESWAGVYVTRTK
ncbi:MAG: hypothetical protein HY856_18490 [Burkholderiales bacterium]|nr:hypothetical protein [Burkholderiales bacterium]